MPYHLATPACKNGTSEPYYMGVLLFGQVIFFVLQSKDIGAVQKYPIP